MTVTVLVKLTVKPSRYSDACAVLTSAGPSMRAESGCIAYDFYSVDADPSTIYVLETWTDMDAFDAHGTQPHLVAMRDKLMPMMDAPPEFIPLTKFGA